MRFGFAFLITKVLQKSSQYRARTSFPTFIVVEVDGTEGLFTTAVKVRFFFRLCGGKMGSAPN